jgi:hypothetical protein
MLVIAEASGLTGESPPTRVLNLVSWYTLFDSTLPIAPTLVKYLLSIFLTGYSMVNWIQK